MIETQEKQYLKNYINILHFDNWMRKPSRQYPLTLGLQKILVYERVTVIATKHLDRF